MRSLVIPIFIFAVLVFLLALNLAYRCWGALRAGQRIGAILLLLPHFLFILCAVLSASCGNAAEGSACYNRQFLTGVLIVFILPAPSLVGTIAALRLFMTARSRRKTPDAAAGGLG